MVRFPRRVYRAGEEHLIEWQVVPNKRNDVIVITAAGCKILNFADEADAEYDCTVNGDTVSIKFKADTPGTYLMKTFVTVPPETIEGELIIEVYE